MLIMRKKKDFYSIILKNQINSNGMIEINSQVDLVDWDNAYTFGGEDYVLNQIISEIELECLLL